LAASNPKSSCDPTTGYARRVVDGEIVAGRLVRLACERHLRDLRAGAARGLRFDINLAQHAIDFFPTFLRLVEGDNADKEFKLEPFQQFIVGSIFGWLAEDGYRRFRTAYVEIGKGNGKTPMAAGIGLYGLCCDEEAGAEIYSAAVTRDQAKILFSDAEKMAKASPHLKRIISFNVANLAVIATNSFFRPISSEARALDGKRVHVALIDEIHEHPNALVVDKMRAGTKARRQALIFEITNSGYDRHSVCWAHHELSTKVLAGIIENDSWFAYIAQLDPCPKCVKEGKDFPTENCSDCDSWTDEATWIKANPGLGTILPRKYLCEQVHEALGMPSKQNIVRRLNFCQWTEQSVRWMPMTVWDECADAQPQTRPEWDALEKSFEKRVCFGGLDLSNKLDLTAFLLGFPTYTKGEISAIDFLCRFWVPEEGARKRGERDRVPYPLWIKQGLIYPTEGQVVDYAFIRRQIQWDAKRFRIKEIAFDPWNATQLATELDGDGLKMIELRQGFQSLTEPTKKLMELALEGKVRHHGHPVLRWNASNVAVKVDSAGNLKPDKEKSTERIDGIVAMILALARIIVQPEPRKSVYETRGLIVL
jgi:phage terminase large subunit-like protein